MTVLPAVALRCALAAAAASALQAQAAPLQRGLDDWLATAEAAARSGSPPPILSPPPSAFEADGATAGPGVLRPTVPAQWTADVGYDGNFAGMDFKDGVGKFMYDRVAQRHRMTYTVKASYFRANATQTQDQLAVGGMRGRSATNMTLSAPGDAGVCMPFSQGKVWNDMFAWVRYAQPAGHREVRGSPCSLWTLEAKAYAMNFSMCVGNDSFPVEMNQTFGGDKFAGRTAIRFKNHVLSAPGDASFLPSKACATYPAPPCQMATVSVLDVYRIFGPPEPLDLENRDSGDVLGDLAFVCTQGSGQVYRGKLITHWKVNVSNAFGQYAMCNYNDGTNNCLGAPEQLRRVGRRSGQMMGVGARLGQCSPNFDVGSQYSFPSEAKCPPGVNPGDAHGCAWGGAVPVRTVQSSCIMEDRGLLEMCKSEIGHAPFLKAVQIWEAAFASAEPALGGCPDAPLGGRAAAALVV